MSHSENDHSVETTSKKRSWFQFGTRSLLVLTFVAAIFFMWFAWKLKQAERQREIVEEYRQLVRYDFEEEYLRTGDFICGTPDSGNAPTSVGSEILPNYPKWLVNWFGVDFLCGVESAYYYDSSAKLNPFVKLDDEQESSEKVESTQGSFFDLSFIPEIQAPKQPPFSPFIDALAELRTLKRFNYSGKGSLDDFQGLSQLTQIQDLDIDCERCNGEKLQCLSKISQLQSLNIFARDWSEISLKPLSELKQLKNLKLGGNINVTKEDVIALSKCPALEVLDISCSPSIVSFGPLTGFPRLKELHNSYVQLTDEDLINLQPLRRLETLHIESKTITGRGWKALQELPQLSTLSIVLEKISESDLKHLELFTQLKELNFCYLVVLSKEQEARLKKALPKTAIIGISNGGPGGGFF